MEVNTRLMDFHLSCKREFNELAKSFNILFYGYGSKRALLMRMFPSAFHFNCKFLKPREILNSIVARLRPKLKALHAELDSVASMSELDRLIGTRRQKYKLLVTNFDFDLMRDFSNLNNFAILGTIENIDIRFSSEDIEGFNFIFRDLTTFEVYKDEIVDVRLKAIGTEASVSVITNVPRSSRLILKEILQSPTDVVGLDGLFEKVKKKLFLTSKAPLLSMINEFVDHRMLRINDSKEIIVNISATERKKLLEKWEQIG